MFAEPGGDRGRFGTLGAPSRRQDVRHGDLGAYPLDQLPSVPTRPAAKVDPQTRSVE